MCILFTWSHIKNEMSWLCPSFCKRQAGSYSFGGLQGVQGIHYVEKKPSLRKPAAKPPNGAITDRSESGIVPDITQQYNTQNYKTSITQIDHPTNSKKVKAPQPTFSVPPPPTTFVTTVTAEPPTGANRGDVDKRLAPQPPQAVQIEEVKSRPAVPESPQPQNEYDQITVTPAVAPKFEKNNENPEKRKKKTRPPAPTPVQDAPQPATENTSTTPEDIYSTSEELRPSLPQQTPTENGADRISTNPGTITNQILNEPTMHLIRKEGIIADRIEESTLKDVFEVIEKDDKTREFIKMAISKNDFLNNMMDENRLEAVTSAMYPQHYEPNQFIIQEGETGSHVFVSAKGKFDVIKNNVVISDFGVGVAFGELAILYRAKRFASIRATTPAKVWILERKVFKRIMMKTGHLERQENLNFLRSVKALTDLSEEKLIQVADLLKREFHAAGSQIVTQGADGDKFYIIRAGTVNVVKRDTQGKERVVNSLKRGDYFGEQALLHRDKRLASVIAEAPGTECLTLDIMAFEKFLGTLEQIKSVVLTDLYPVEKPKPQPVVINEKYAHITLRELEIVGTLGVGGFGRVELVRYKKTNETFALKYLKKVEMVKQQHQQHVYSEKDIMASCDSAFIIKLFNTYRDSKYLYFLMEACLGGDVWTVLQSYKHFDEVVGRFMTACVIEALEYLHTRNMVYRDLKPENLMLDQKGYVKLVDFGFAKRVGPTQHTWTFAGTPEYVAPEIILNKGHDRAVDYWALGVLVHELLVGKPPFRGRDHMKTYSLILRGIDVLPMPARIPKKVQDLIRKLCRQIPTERLGYARNGIADIKSHTWFHGYDWEKLHKQTLPAPLVRKVKSNTDLSYFEPYPRDEDDPPDETSGWDVYF